MFKFLFDCFNRIFLKNSNRVYIYCILIVFVLSVIKSVYIFNFKYKSDVSVARRNCVILCKNKVTDDKITYLVKYNENKFLLNITIDKNQDEDKIKQIENFKYGDILSFRASVYIPQRLGNPYEFDYKKYLNSNNIVGIFTTNDARKIGNSVHNILEYLGNSIKECIELKVEQNLPKNEANLYKSMIYGNDIYLDDKIKQDFSENGILYILVTSGMHVYYISVIINYLTKRMNPKISVMFKIIVIGIFLIISNFSVSVLRAGIMSIISCFSMKEKSKNDNNGNNIKNLFLSAVVLLCVNPYYIFNSSFLLSYLSTFGIIMFQNYMVTLFSVKLYFLPKNILKISLIPLGVVATSFSTLICTLPLQIKYFGCINLFSFASSVIVSPVITFEFFIGFLSFIFSCIPLISDLLISSNYILLKVIIKVVEILSKLNYFTLYIPRFSKFEVCLYYIMIFVIITKKYISLIMSKLCRKVLRCISFIMIVSTIFCMLFFSIYRLYFEEYVYFFNVEQGNMAIIRKNRKVIIVDIGSTTKNLAYNIISNFLNAKAIHKIDIVFLTHMHEDHVNGIYKLLENFKVCAIAFKNPPEGYENNEFYNIINLANNKKIRRIEVNYMDDIDVTGINVKVITSKKNEVINSSDMLNSNSSVYLVELNKNSSILFMGDATKETEKWILKNAINEKANLFENVIAIQIGHHGSKTSTSEEFIKNFKDAVAIISSKKKKYGHPSSETIEILKKYNFDIVITEKEGAYSIKF